jgi:hypothetical protein
MSHSSCPRNIFCTYCDEEEQNSDTVFDITIAVVRMVLKVIPYMVSLSEFHEYKRNLDIHYRILTGAFVLLWFVREY